MGFVRVVPRDRWRVMTAKDRHDELLDMCRRGVTGKHVLVCEGLFAYWARKLREFTRFTGMLLALAFMAAPAAGQGIGGIAASAFPRQVTVALLPAAGSGAHGLRIVTDDSDCNAATADDGIVLCLDTGASWVLATGSGGAVTLAGDVDGDSGSTDLDEAAVEAELEAVLDLDQQQGQIGDAQIADAAVDGGTGGEIADGSVTAADLGAASVGSSELDEADVEAGLEAVLDLADLQGAVTDSQVPDTITVDLATVATTANAGDSATSFFSSGTVEAARLPAVTALSSACTDAQVLGGTAGGTGVECQAAAGGANPAGSGSELQYRSNGTTFGAVTGSSVSGGTIALAGGSFAAPSLSLGATAGGLFEEGSVGLALKPGSGGYIRFYGADGNAKWHQSPNTYHIANAAGSAGSAVMSFSTGSDTVPVWTFTSNLTSGLGLGATNQPSMVAGGTEVARFSTTHTTFNNALRLTPVSAPPVTCGSANTAGVLYFDDDTDEVCACTGSAWVGLVAGGSCS
jgi:hypothetical protein